MRNYKLLSWWIKHLQVLIGHFPIKYDPSVFIIRIYQFWKNAGSILRKYLLFFVSPMINLIDFYFLRLLFAYKFNQARFSWLRFSTNNYSDIVGQYSVFEILKLLNELWSFEISLFGGIKILSNFIMPFFLNMFGF